MSQVHTGMSVWVVALALAAVGRACARPDEAKPDAAPIPDPAATDPHETLPKPQPFAFDARVASSPASAAARAEVAPRGAGSPSSAVAPPLARPLAAWMRSEATRAFQSHDLETIGRSFDRMAAWAPAEYSNWASISEDGARAARAGSMEGVKAACRGCHEQYKADYAARFSTRPLS